LNNLVFDLVGIYSWTPATVRGLTLSEANACQHGRRRALGGVLSALAAVAGGMVSGGAEEVLRSLLEAGMPQTTLEDRVGPKMAAEAAESEQRNKEWLERRKRGGT
jgi:hypothetical protein